jgi:hypothetical protein
VLVRKRSLLRWILRHDSRLSVTLAFTGCWERLHHSSCCLFSRRPSCTGDASNLPETAIGQTVASARWRLQPVKGYDRNYWARYITHSCLHATERMLTCTSCLFFPHGKNSVELCVLGEGGDGRNWKPSQRTDSERKAEYKHGPGRNANTPQLTSAQIHLTFFSPQVPLLFVADDDR